MVDSTQTGTKANHPAITAAEEQELKQRYRAHYETLVTQARDALGDGLGHFSGKVAQQAMLATWKRRADFTTPERFDAALYEVVKSEAATQRRKHAALHQREGSAPRAPHVVTLTTDQAVAQMLAALHEVPLDHATAATAALDARKQHAAEHVQLVARRRPWKGPAALVVVLGVVIVAAMRWMNDAGAEVAVKKALAGDDARTLSAARGQRGNVDLADGTKARIGSESRLRLPAAFGTTMRTSEVEGTVMFAVAAGQPLPFTVWAGNAVVTATGTRFTVRAFPEDSAVVIGVDEGSVVVRVKNEREETAVAAGQAVRVTLDGKVAPLDAASADGSLSWVRDSLVFTDTPTSVVLRDLERWMSLGASLADSTLGARKVSLRVALESTGDALAALTKAANLTVGFDKEDKVVLSDATTAPVGSKR